jgi:hypothetical protein
MDHGICRPRMVLVRKNETGPFDSQGCYPFPTALARGAFGEENDT